MAKAQSKPKKKKIKIFIEDLAERRAAAKYIAVSDLGLDDLIARHNNNVSVAYSVADSELFSETGHGAGEEMQDWMDHLNDGDEYSYNVWQEYKKENPKVKW